jgi:lysozyme
MAWFSDVPGYIPPPKAPAAPKWVTDGPQAVGAPNIPEPLSGPSAACLSLCKRVEGCKLVAYPDVNGVWTIGYGSQHLNGVPVVQGQTITQAQADAELYLELNQVAHFIMTQVTVPLKQSQLDALTDFAYNCGGGAFQGSSLRAAINAKHPVTEDLFTRWNKIHVNGQLVDSTNLTARRKAEYALFIS